MEIGRALGFVFQDEEWIKKLGIGAALLLVPGIGNLAVLGWSLEVTRRVIHEEEEVLPDWSGLVDYLKKGFVASVIALVYFLPILLFQGCAYGFLYVAPEMFSGQDADTAGIVAIIAMSCLSLLYIFLASVFLPSAYGNYAVSGSMGSALKFSQVFKRVRSAPGAHLIAAVGAGVALLIIAPLGLIACSIGVFVTFAYAFLITGHLNGQAYLASGIDPMETGAQDE